MLLILEIEWLNQISLILILLRLPQINQPLAECLEKNTRESVVHCSRNSMDILNAFNQNPYSKPLNSVA